MDSHDSQSEQVKKLSAVVTASLDEENATGSLPRKALHSRSHFYRLFQALINETPGGMRRRLLLERAAWKLSRTDTSITELAFDAGYASLEAFTRAFRKAFRVSPSLYRRMGATHIRLAAPNEFHFSAPASSAKGHTDMDLFERFAGADSWHTKRLLEQAQSLTDAQLDQPIHNTVELFGFSGPDKNLREILERIVQTIEIWSAALTGSEMPSLTQPPEQRTPRALLERFEKADGEFNRVLCDVEKRRAWDDTFVDALCEPAESFTFGGTFAHVITFNAYRRLTALDALRQLGVNTEGFGCPMEYEAIVAPWRSDS